METVQWSKPSSSSSLEGVETNKGPPPLRNHSLTHFNGYLYCFGGYDGLRNLSTLFLYSIQEQQWIRPVVCATKEEVPDDNSFWVTGQPPASRNGHTATLLPIETSSPSGDTLKEEAKIVIIGGWLGTGPWAASDMHVLEISQGGRRMKWNQPTTSDTASIGTVHFNRPDPLVLPGPCNMHSAEYVETQKRIYVFRGGDGQNFFSEVRTLDPSNWTWTRLETNGTAPSPRSTQASAVVQETGQLFIFGGWNGKERMNDIHVLDTATSTWTSPQFGSGGVPPPPCAGMTCTVVGGRLYVFGGTVNTQTRECLDDLRIFDCSKMTWLDTMVVEGDEGDRLESFQPSIDDDALPKVIVQGKKPSKRSGHRATAVDKKIFIFGGGNSSIHSNKLFNDMFILDTDPPQ